MRFSDEVEHRKAMIEMQGAVGCGSKPLRVSAATPKRYYTTLCYHFQLVFTSLYMSYQTRKIISY